MMVYTPDALKQDVIGYVSFPGPTFCVPFSPVPFNDIPPFSLPSNSTYKGKAVVNGITACTIWAVENFVIFTGAFTGLMYISDASNIIVQVVGTLAFGGGSIMAQFESCATTAIPITTFNKPTGC